MPHLEITEVNYSEYDEIIVWFTDQKSRALEIEDRINLTMVVKQHIKIRYSIEPRDRIYVKGYGKKFCECNFEYDFVEYKV